MSAASVGRAVGAAYLPGEGMAVVFASDSTDYFTVQANATGHRRYMHRNRINWRKA